MHYSARAIQDYRRRRQLRNVPQHSRLQCTIHRIKMYSASPPETRRSYGGLVRSRCTDGGRARRSPAFGDEGGRGSVPIHTRRFLVDRGLQLLRGGIRPQEGLPAVVSTKAGFRGVGGRGKIDGDGISRKRSARDRVRGKIFSYRKSREPQQVPSGPRAIIVANDFDSHILSGRL